MSDSNAVVGTNTIGKMIKAKVIAAKQTGLFIQLKNLHDKKRADGTCWNRRDMQSEKTKAHIQGLVEHIQTGGMLPAIEVQPHPDGGVQKIDGYCRAEAYAIADASGVGELWVAIVPFEGTELEALGRISTSNKDEKLTPLEQLDLYKSIRDQLIADGNAKPSLQNIADVAKVTRQYVDQILKLDALDDKGRALVEGGKVTVAFAVKSVRADAENATAALEEAAKNAEAKGLKKASSTTLKEITPPSALLLDIHQIGMNLRGNIDKSAVAACESFLRGESKGDVPITIPVREVAMLLAALREGERYMEDAKSKAQAKADKAKQLPIAGDVETESHPDQSASDDKGLSDDIASVDLNAEEPEDPFEFLDSVSDDEPESEPEEEDEQEDEGGAFAFLG